MPSLMPSRREPILGLPSRRMPMQLPEALKTRGHHILHLPSVDSTMEEARRQRSSGVIGPLWIVADEQTGGRGRQGRTWVSPRGNLHLTLVLPAPCALRDQPKLGFVAGVALATAVRTFCSAADVRLKWPNDLLINGAKSAGLLLEGLDAGAAVSIGIGINIVAHPDDTPYPATHLRAAGNFNTTAQDVLSAVSFSMLHALETFGNGSGFPLIRERWMARAAYLGRRIIVRRENPLEGLFLDIDSDGRLMLETLEGILRIDAGDVFPLDKSCPPPHDKH